MDDAGGMILLDAALRESVARCNPDHHAALEIERKQFGVHSAFEPLRSTTSKVVGKRTDSGADATIWVLTIEFSGRARYVALDQRHRVDATNEELGSDLIAEIKATIAVYYAFDGDEELSEEFVRVFSRTEAQREAWSLWKQWFNTQVAALHLPLANLPQPNVSTTETLASLMARKLGVTPN